MNKAAILAASVFSLMFAAGAARADSLAELDALSKAAPEDYGRLYDKDLASATMGGQPQVTQAQLKQMMLSDLDSLQGMIAARYAPAGWKKEQYGWDLNAQIQQAKDKINASDSFGVKDYQQLLKSLLNSMKDYHVSVSFYSTEASMLPFSVTEAQGHYFISGINRKALPQNVFPYNVGDEVVSFDGRPVADLIAEYEKKAGMGDVPHTDASMAAIFLTYRSGANGDTVPQGPVSVGIKAAGAPAAAEFPMKWTYVPEMIAPQPFVSKNKGISAPKIPMSWLGMMMVDVASAPGGAQASYGIGNKDGFLPDFGEKTWTAPADNGFRAYVYKSPSTGRNIGFVRIPTYAVSDPEKAAKDFAALVPELNNRADALVIDETNNPGGIVLYLYALASMLTDTPLAAPKHYITLTQADVSEAINFIQESASAKTDDDAKQVLGDDVAGYPVDLPLLQNWTAFYVDTVKQWSAGRTITTPLAVFGIDTIKPAAVHYSKPVMILTNQLDFSGGDFVPAIMQDNKRAVIFGERTAGAGGVVKEYKRENNLLGVQSVHLTATIAQRAGGEPIENLGVTPDIPYAVTPADVQGNYAGYLNAVDAAVNGLIK
jgi:hypothetical protein